MFWHTKCVETRLRVAKNKSIWCVFQRKIYARANVLKEGKNVREKTALIFKTFFTFLFASSGFKA